MGGLCGGSHEISGMKAPLFLHGGWLEGSWSEWVGGNGVRHGWMVVVGWVGFCGDVVGPHDAPHVIFQQFGEKT